jgi:hypothetical protein
MSVGNQVKQTAIEALVHVIDGGHLFPRVLDEMKRANAALPGADGPTKKKRVVADLKIIFDDLVWPVGEAVINLLIELGVAYLSATNPVAGMIVGNVAPGVAQAAESQIDSKIAASKQ